MLVVLGDPPVVLVVVVLVLAVVVVVAWVLVVVLVVLAVFVVVVVLVLCGVVVVALVLVGVAVIVVVLVLAVVVVVAFVPVKDADPLVVASAGGTSSGRPCCRTCGTRRPRCRSATFVDTHPVSRLAFSAFRVDVYFEAIRAGGEVKEDAVIFTRIDGSGIHDLP